MLLRFLLYAFGIYLLFRFIFDFLVPVVRTTRQVRRQFRHMQDHMREQMQAGNPAQETRPREQAHRSGIAREGDYIEFEEVRR